MQCADYQRWLSPYLDDALEAAQRSDLEIHLKGCSGCTEALASLKKLLVSLRQLGDIEAPKDLLHGVQTKLLAEPAWKGWMPSVLRAFSGHRVAVALTAGLVVIVAAPLVLRQPARKSVGLAKSAHGQDSIRVDRRLQTQNVPIEEGIRDGAQAPQRQPAAVGGFVPEDLDASTMRGRVGDESAQIDQAEQSDVIVQGSFVSGAKAADEKDTTLLGLSDAQGISALEGRRTREHVQQRQPKTVSGSGLKELQVATEAESTGDASGKKYQLDGSELWVERGALLEDNAAAISLAPVSSPTATVQLEWTVSDRTRALEQLKSWLITAQGTLQPAGDDRVFLQIPQARYASLVDELSKHGRIQFPVKEEFEKNKIAESRTKQPAAPYSAPSTSSSEQLMTIELYLIQQQ